MKSLRPALLCLTAALLCGAASAQHRGGGAGGGFHGGFSPHGDAGGGAPNGGFRGPQNGGFHGPEGHPHYDDRGQGRYWQSPYRYRRGEHFWGYENWNNDCYYQGSAVCPSYAPGVAYPYAYAPEGAPGVQIVP